MLPLLSSLLIAQTSSPLTFREVNPHFITQPQQIRTLPGKLNDVLVFNSNSPEVIEAEGILLSTFPPNGKRVPNAHLNKPLEGRFDVFTHHISRPSHGRTLYQGLLVHNPTSRTVIIRVLQGASYRTSPDAPFINLPPLVEDPSGQVYSGPGSRLMSDILRGVNHNKFPQRLILRPYESQMLFTLPISPSNGRSTFLRLYSNGPVYMANLAMYEVPKIEMGADKKPKTSFRTPNIDEWRYLVTMGRLVTPRDLPPTPLDQDWGDRTIYGRVSGISVGSEWIARLTDEPKKTYLSIPQRGQAFSYPLSTVTTGTHGTKQIQSAPMLARYPDTAYRAHGNYGVHYSLTIPLTNRSSERQTVALTLQTPFKQNHYADRLIFANRPEGQVFFRGTVKISYKDRTGNPQERYFHLVQRRGQQGEPLVRINLDPGERREVEVDFLYPPDATPPQVLTVQTLDLFYGQTLPAE
ncbi:conserved hypothetical protein [Rippkaea orientalis PCC 8801]|uniref:DUF3370 domain-containing protein n=1 Tax=Rippkaea orientalis (strain PCC 8801 / RF-1) TaxID=41431 RepID=B7K590_RIPO1|nr:DUF3370 domain-containing protein [Rippkaea orientalis]ACK67916.1 conserved hypothetical protein [Rippkaea orientalis PCC 8801]